MLSRLHWLQTVALGLLTGLLWLGLPRTEAAIHDIQGWMFFSNTYWMLFAHFGALTSCELNLILICALVTEIPSQRGDIHCAEARLIISTIPALIRHLDETKLQNIKFAVSQQNKF